MNKLNMTGKQIRALGFEEGPVISIAMNTMNMHYKFTALIEAEKLLKNVLENPANFLEHEFLGNIAKKLIANPDAEAIEIKLNETSVPYKIFGAEHVEDGALEQMDIASKLPVAVAGALMPDAHKGYGLPIGGVLATKNAIIPYAVGVDIGCRMCLSIFDMKVSLLADKINFFERELNENTLFGSGRDFNTRETQKGKRDHSVLYRNEFNEIPFLKNLQAKASNQLGSSGSGNHFVEFGEIEILNDNDIPNVPKGNYVGLLTHSGSRGLGALIADNYTRLAMKETILPNHAKHLAWLDMNKESGIEYWLAMNLAGDYASACHHVIHEKIATSLGEKALAMVENHHNFAWKEMYNNEEVIVHRKGATPAGKNVLGIIPGSMTAPGFIVKGLGENESLNSASHGAGRKMSRTKALANITYDALRAELNTHGVTLIGGGLDEAPFAYKNINDVMQSQTNLVDIIGKFTPKIVKMDGSSPIKYRKKRNDNRNIEK